MIVSDECIAAWTERRMHEASAKMASAEKTANGKSTVNGKSTAVAPNRLSTVRAEVLLLVEIARRMQRIKDDMKAMGGSELPPYIVDEFRALSQDFVELDHQLLEGEAEQVLRICKEGEPPCVPLAIVERQPQSDAAPPNAQ